MTDELEPEELRFLTTLEREEAALLTWGIVDGFFTRPELVERADAFLNREYAAGRSSRYLDADALINALEERVLVWELPFERGRYRTRVAETIRLLANLKQRFRHDDWQAARRLVADYRYQLRPRAYPRRNITSVGALEQLGDATPDGSLQRLVVARMLRHGTANPWALAQFQLDATKRLLTSSGSLGTIVCAGTGSGKTLAFYLPVLARLASEVDDKHWVRCLALYPRKELLKDQLSSALANAHHVAGVLAEAGKRGLRIGALYGDVPHNGPHLLANAKKGGYLDAWVQTRAGSPALRCPYATCPGCGGPIAWRRSDAENRNEVLYCESDDCNSVVRGEFAFTRDSLKKCPPDVLFTSTEMMNRYMASADFRHLFGIGVRAPTHLLLDEVHTYQGVQGAQTALLIRRWKYLSRARPHFVGLSATLADAPRFFSDLTGLFPSQVSEIRPGTDDLVWEGAEYLLALRGDALSGASLLSTSMQVSMLLRRVLDDTAQVSRGAFGRKAFAFTDNLDVINRFYHNLLDAEGFDRPRRPNRNPLGSLANLRSLTPALDAHSARWRAGESWDLCRSIGHDLSEGHRETVGRTSSQDSGVDSETSLVVATAALEVGYDDPAVGAVIQHKAPRGAASFLQRIGRAGRLRQMRPLIAVVLSEYGRDRSAYQDYTALFSPLVKPRSLPTQNRYVLRMQAAWALIEWLHHGAKADGEPWRDLSAPATSMETNAKYRAELERRQERYVSILDALLREPEQHSDLQKWLADALSIDEATAQALMWEPPRALMTTVAPTLQRRLQRQWSTEGNGLESFRKGQPLPEFVPRAMFQDLNLPEVAVMRPDAPEADPLEWMPIAHALKEFAPGGVSLRFATWSAHQALWIAPHADAVDIDDFCAADDRQELGTFEHWSEPGVVKSVRVVRPYRIRPQAPDDDVVPTSQGFPIWNTQIVSSGPSHDLEVPRQAPVGTLVNALGIHTHELQNPVEIRRFITESEYSVRFSDHRSEEGVHGLQLDGEPAALGFAADVDAAVFHVPRVHDLWRRFVGTELIKSLRVALFRHLIEHESELEAGTNIFQRRWLAELVLAALVKLAWLEASVESVPTEALLSEAANALPILFGGAETGMTERHGEMLTLLKNETTAKAVSRCRSVLHEVPGPSWEDWLQARFRTTLGAALAAGVARLCPEVELEELNVDLDPGPRPGAVQPVDTNDSEIWLTENSPGGVGLIEEFHRRYSEDPRRYFRMVAMELRDTDMERATHELEKMIALVGDSKPTSPRLRAAFGGVRSSVTHEQLRDSSDELGNAARAADVDFTPRVSAALHARVLRAGSSDQTDKVLATLVALWDEVQAKLGFEVELSSFAYACVHHRFDQLSALSSSLSPSGDTIGKRYGVLTGVLWPRGLPLRADALDLWNPFAQHVQADRLIVESLLDHDIQRFRLSESNWKEGFERAIWSDGIAEIAASRSERELLAAEILRRTEEPIDIGALLIYPRLQGVQRIGEDFVALFDSPEAIQ